MAKVKSSSKREHMLNIAKRMFLAGSFDKVSMDQISIHAGVSKNTLYNHFTNKEQLFQTIIENHWEQSTSPRLALDNTNDAKTHLKHFAHQLLAYLYDKETFALFRCLIAASQAFPNLSKRILRNHQAPIHANISQYLEQQHQLSPSLASKKASFLLGMLKEDPFWHVLCGFRPRYTKQALKNHAESVIDDFMQLVPQL